MNLPVNLFGKEPALVVAFLQAVVMAFVTFKLGVSPEQGALISVAVSALAGGYAAYAVKQNLLPAIVAAFQALVAVGVAYGLHLSPEETGALTAGLVGLLGLFLRTQADPKAGSPAQPDPGTPTPTVIVSTPADPADDVVPVDSYPAGVDEPQPGEFPIQATLYDGSGAGSVKRFKGPSALRRGALPRTLRG